MDYFFIKPLKPHKTINQLLRRRQIYKGFGLDYYLLDTSDKIVGFYYVESLIVAKKTVMILSNSLLFNGRVNCIYTNEGYRVEKSNHPFFRAGQYLSKFDSFHKVMKDNFDIKFN